MRPMRQVQEHDPETWKPVFGQDHARNEWRGGRTLLQGVSSS